MILNRHKIRNRKGGLNVESWNHTLHADRRFCPGTNDFKMIRERKGGLQESKKILKLLDLSIAAAVPQKKLYSEHENWSNAVPIQSLLPLAFKKAPRLDTPVPLLRK